MVSINELVKQLINKGYKTTPRAIKYYIEQGLMPKPEKRGGYREGVRLVFPDKEEALARLFKIFELKGRGFKLSEIEEFLKDEKRKEGASKLWDYFKSFVEIDGRFYLILEKEPDGKRYKYADCLKNALIDLDRESEFLHHLDEVEGRGLFVTPYMYQKKIVYDLDMMTLPLSWVELRRQYDFEWDVLEAIFKKHIHNFDRDFHWPNLDSVQYLKAWVGFHRQWALNFFGADLIEYINWIQKDFLDAWEDEDMFSTRILDFKYSNINIFIEDFLSGNCAFVPSPFGGSDWSFKPFGGSHHLLKPLECPVLFLKKFKS